MPKLGASSSHPTQAQMPNTQAKVIPYRLRRAKKKPPAMGICRNSRKISRTPPLPPPPSSSSCRQGKRDTRRQKQAGMLCDDDDLGSQIPLILEPEYQIHTRRRKAASKLGLGDDDGDLEMAIPIWGAKRARSSAPPLLPATDPDWRDWTNLGDGPAGLIAERLLANDVADYICFRAVCRPWRLWSTDPREHGVLDRRFHPRQWIMFRTRKGDSCRGFINLSTGCFRYVNLPEIHGHDVFGPTSEGLLVLLDLATYVIRLLNPFTGQAASLPPATTLLSPTQQQPQLRSLFLRVSGAGLADDSTVAVLFGEISTVAVVKPGDARWTVVHHHGMSFLPALSFAGRFYCVSPGRVMVVETSSAGHPPRLAVATKLARPISAIMMDSAHLVDIDGKLMLVDRQSNGSRRRRKFTIYHVDLSARKMVPVCGLGGRAAFIGRERSISVSPSVFPSVVANTVYLSYDRLLSGIMDYSPIHLMDGGIMDHSTIHEDRSPVPLMNGGVRSPKPRDDEFIDHIDGMPLYGPQRVDEYLSCCVTGHHDRPVDHPGVW